MKKIFYSLLALATLSLVGCSGDNNPNEGKFHADPEAGFVYFENPNTLKNDDVVYIPVSCSDEAGEAIAPFFLNAYVNRNGLNVDYTIEEVQGSTDGITVDATVPAGTLDGEVRIAYPAGITSDIVFDVVFQSTSKSNVLIGHPDSTEEEVLRVYLNATNARALTGFYESNIPYDEDNDPTPIYEVSPGSLDNEIIVPNLSTIFTEGSTSTTRVFVNEDGTLSGPEATENYLYDNENVGATYVANISGTYDACEGTFTMTFILTFSGGSTSSQTVIFKK